MKYTLLSLFGGLCIGLLVAASEVPNWLVVDVALALLWSLLLIAMGVDEA